MFSNLIESGSHTADLKRKGRFVIATTVFYGLLLALTGVGSIYAYNARLEYDPEYEFISLLRFPPVSAAAEQPRREERRAATSPTRSNQIAVRTEISTHTPYAERVASRATRETPPGQAVVIGLTNFTPEEPGSIVGPPSSGLHGSTTGGGPTVTNNTGEPPPAATPTPTPQPTPRRETGPVRLTSSLISSKAIDKPAPPYPAIAKTARIQGTVAVQIVIDEQGGVISARATDGPPLLLNAAVQAAYRARFTPTILGGQPVKVTGSITYNFVLN